MDSLLASYASDSDGEQEAAATAPQMSGKSLFASLPPARNRAIEDIDEIPPAGGGLFNSLPAPKSQSSEKKRVVQFRPPIDLSVLAKEDEDDKKPKKNKGGDKGEAKNVVLGDLVLPAPRNKSLGAVLGAGRRVEAGSLDLESLAEEYPGPQLDAGTSDGYGAEFVENSQQAVYGAEYSQQAGYAADYSQQAGVYGSYGAEYSQQVGAYASDGAEYSQQPEGYVVEYAQQQAGAQESYSEQPDSSEMYLETRSYGASEFPQSGGDGAPRDFTQERKRKGRGEPVNFVEIKQADLTKNRPREDQFRMTGIAFGAPFEKRDDEENKPSRLHKRKHQIGSLYYDMRQKEFELMERRARGQQSKSQTMAKYGW